MAVSCSPSARMLLASPLRRLGAALTDLAVLLAADVVLFYCLAAILPAEKAISAFPGIVTSCSLAYLIILWGRGQTVGKQVLGIKVVGPDGKPPGLLRGALRFLGYVIASLPFKIGLLPILWDPLRRGWHDQIAGTLVVKQGVTDIPVRRPDSEPVSPDESASGTIRWRDLAMLPVFAVATALVTWPVVARLATHFPSDGGDANQSVWNLWWVRQAILDPHLGVFQTDYIFWPNTVSLRLHTLSPFNCALAMPLQAFLSPTASYSVLLLLALRLNAFAAYLLGKYVTGSVSGGLLVGLFFGFCPYILWHAQGHLNLVSSEWAIIYVLLIVVVLRKARARHALLAALALVLAGLCSWHHLTYVTAFTAVFLPAWLVVHKDGRARRIGLIAVAVLLAAASLTVWLVPAWRDFTSGCYKRESAYAGQRANRYSLDAGSLLVPPPYHPVFGRWTKPLYRLHLGRRTGVEQASYVGFTVVVLVVAASWDSRRRRAHLPWLMVALACVLLSFGFRLRVFGRTIPGPPVWLALAAGGPPGSGMDPPLVPSLASQVAVGLTAGEGLGVLRGEQVADMPFAWLWRIGRVMCLASCPARFVWVANLCLAILAAIGALHLARGMADRRGKWAGRAFLAALAGLVMFEYLIAPRFPTELVAVHQFYRQLARDRECAAILEAGMRGWVDSHFQRAQTIHGKRLYRGSISRVPDHAHDFIRSHPLLSEALSVLLQGPAPWKFGLSQQEREALSLRKISAYRADVRALAETGCCYIVVHKELIEPRSLPQAQRLLGRALGLPLALDDTELAVYRVRPAGKASTYGECTSMGSQEASVARK